MLKLTATVVNNTNTVYMFLNFQFCHICDAGQISFGSFSGSGQTSTGTFWKNVLKSNLESASEQVLNLDSMYLTLILQLCCMLSSVKHPQ